MSTTDHFMNNNQDVAEILIQLGNEVHNFYFSMAFERVTVEYLFGMLSFNSSLTFSIEDN